MNEKGKLQMKLCERGLNFFQIYNDLGDVRICSWIKDGDVGNLLEHSIKEIYHGEAADKVRKRLAAANYYNCNRDDCPWLACDEINDHLIEIDEVPEYPEEIYLAFENACNYNCSTCNMHERMLAADKKELEKRYDLIEAAVKEVLPYVKRISANGQGEVFVSKRIMRLLSDWKPIAPKEQCSVSLETNGSLFDEEHWKQIENLGQYHLTVTITVMSFDEYTYRQLSGTRLPIEQIEKNLRYVKSLREKGIVDEFRIATVVQERNFRELPSFTKRCIEEFEADYVRLRSFVPWGKKPLEEEWFTDVINPYHPYHAEYVEIMKDPIFKHPKVHDWSGGVGTSLGEHPNKKKLNYAIKKINIQQKYILEGKKYYECIYKAIPINQNIIIYGIGEIGKLLVHSMCSQYKIEAILDNNYCELFYQEIPVYSMKNVNKVDKRAYVLITPLGDTVDIKQKLLAEGFDKAKIITVDELFKED